jgi:hypothetical protein
MFAGNRKPPGRFPIAGPPKPGDSGAPTDMEVPTCGRVGGVPCRERWKALIFASILCGNWPPTLICALLRFEIVGDGPFGLRAFCTKPRGVEDEVMDAVPWGSDVDRSEGILGVLEVLEVLGESNDGLPSGDSSSSVDCGVRRIVAKSIESSGALGGLSGGVAMAAYPNLYSRGIGGVAIDQS